MCVLLFVLFGFISSRLFLADELCMYLCTCMLACICVVYLFLFFCFFERNAFGKIQSLENKDDDDDDDDGDISHGFYSQRSHTFIQ